METGEIERVPDRSAPERHSWGALGCSWVLKTRPRLMEGVEETADPWVVMVNPVVTPVTDEVELGWERCLSIPGLHGKVPRHQRVGVTYQTLEPGHLAHDLARGEAMWRWSHPRQITRAVVPPAACERSIRWARRADRASPCRDRVG
jgi:hypothetical protein